jgi:BlaI family transcriptional regulator, penicillinase repressor
MTTTASICENPMCGCPSCTCADCRCGIVRLGHLESRVMDVVWDQSSQEPTVRDVAQVFPDLAYTTVATMLDRLAEKGVARSRMERGAKRFAARCSRADYTALFMYDVLRRTPETGEALARFADMVSPTEAEALAAALRRRKRSL